MELFFISNTNEIHALYYFRAGPKISKGDTRIFWGLDESEYVGIAVVGLGKRNVGINKLEEIDEGKENVRTAAAGRFSNLLHPSAIDLFQANK